MFTNKETELANELNQISKAENAVDCFVHDLIMHEFCTMWGNKSVQAELVETVQKSLKSIMRSYLLQSETPTVAFSFAHFKKLSPHLYDVGPILKSFPLIFLESKNLGSKNYKELAEMITKLALEQTELMAKKLKSVDMDRRKIQELDHLVSILKLCSGIELSDEVRSNFRFRLNKISIFSTYLSQISHNLDDVAARIACTACDSLYKSTDSENVFGTDYFRAQLLLSLSRSAEAIEIYCAKEQTGNKNCAFCPQPMKTTKSALFSHQCSMPMVHDTNVLASLTEPRKSIWKQFRLNIVNAFLAIVKENVIEICEKDALDNYIELCLSLKRRSFKKQDDVPWVTDQTKQRLLSLIATSDRGRRLDNTIQDIITRSRNEVDLERTYDMLLSVYEFVYRNQALPDSKTMNSVEITASQIRLVAKMKVELLEFIDKSIGPNADTDPKRFQGAIPSSVMDILKRGGESANCAQKFFIQSICHDHGMNMYQKVKSIPHIAPLIPQVLRSSQTQLYFDVFLVLGPNYQTLLSEIRNDLFIAANRAIERLITVTDVQIKNLIVYRLLTEIRSLPSVPKSMEHFEGAVLENKVSGVSRSLIDRNDKLAPNGDALRQFVFYCQTFLEVHESCGFMAPFKDIFLVRRGRVSGLYLPTCPDSVNRRVRLVEKAMPRDEFKTWNTCPNGHVYAIANCGRPFSSGKCPDCGSKIGGVSMHKFTKGNQKIGDRGGTIDVRDQDVTDYKLPHNWQAFDRSFLNEFNGNVMQLFIHAVLYICSNDEEMLKCLRANVKFVGNSISRSEEDVYKFLLTVVGDSSIKTLQGSFEDEDQREVWEIKFIDIINASLQKLPDVIAAYNDLMRQNDLKEEESLLQVLTEVSENRSDAGVLANEFFWRRLPKITLTGIQSELNTNGDKYKLLSCIFRDWTKNEEWVPQLSLIPDLFELFNSIISYYDPDTANRVQSFEDFLLQRKIPVPVRRKMRETASVFCRLWNRKIRHMSLTSGGIQCEFKDVLKLHSPLKYFLPSRHVSDCCALVTVNILVNKNNELVQAYRSALQIDTPLVKTMGAPRNFFLREERVQKFLLKKFYPQSLIKKNLKSYALFSLALDYIN